MQTENKVEKAMSLLREACKIYSTMSPEEKDLFMVEYDKMEKEDSI